MSYDPMRHAFEEAVGFTWGINAGANASHLPSCELTAHNQHRYRKLRANRTIQNPINPAQTAHRKITRQKTWPYRACTASGFSPVMFAMLRPVPWTMTKLAAANMRAKDMATMPLLPACCSPILDIAPVCQCRQHSSFRRFIEFGVDESR